MMDYTTKRPAEEGAYWVRHEARGKLREWTVNIKRDPYNGELRVDGVGPLSIYGIPQEMEAGCRMEFYGPLIPPSVRAPEYESVRMSRTAPTEGALAG